MKRPFGTCMKKNSYAKCMKTTRMLLLETAYARIPHPLSVISRHSVVAIVSRCDNRLITIKY